MNTFRYYILKEKSQPSFMCDIKKNGPNEPITRISYNN